MAWRSRSVYVRKRGTACTGIPFDLALIQPLSVPVRSLQFSVYEASDFELFRTWRVSYILYISGT